ncbi:PH domain-containing protein [Chroococcidiopsis sp. SAG 2025]|uniref:PH domain-containing protein n=1 Tax=Chroococcidiopsis sp. SAG 2025 TaxID=171389 RepID=UPI002936DE65|nr:PH domain-containing protein [Chroococcidiopsis sp. SAG 2025]
MGMVFNAPWDKSLIFSTILFSAILLGIALIGVLVGEERSNFLWLLAMVVLPLVILIASALFGVRGYKLTNNALYIQRFGWNSRIPLTQLIDAESNPHAMDNSLRTWGNGGLFGITGWFRNDRLGSYQAYATDPLRSVVLRFPQRTIVLTPDNPEQFVRAVLARQMM